MADAIRCMQASRHEACRSCLAGRRRASSATPRATPLRRSRRAPRARLPRSSSAATQQSGVPAAISGLRSLLLLGCLGRQGARHIHTAPSVLWVAVRGGLRERGREGETSSRVSADLVTASCRQPRPRRQIPFVQRPPRRWTEAIALKQLLNRHPRSFLVY